MPEQPFDSPDMENLLEFLEDYGLTTYPSRCQNYQKVQSTLESKTNLSDSIIKRLLDVCIHDLNEDMKYAAITLNVISLILKKIKARECPMPELLPSAFAVLNILKTTALVSKVQILQNQCIETFLQYPDEILIELGSEHCGELLEVFNLYLHQGISVGVRLLPFNILYKILKILPPDKKLNFVRQGLGIWFAKVIPSTMTVVITGHSMVAKMLDALDLLTTELLAIDYTENTQWLNIMECIYTPSKYPAIMKALLESGNDSWHRLWIIFVRLLKQQITISQSRFGSPINSMLPIVEMAFKMSYAHRVKAFQCWNELIDNFAMETNESFTVKRTKLLIIPLKSNNAKVEEVAIAKFDTWWHLLRKFHSRIDKVIDLAFVPYLHFCFGSHNKEKENNVLLPGLVYKELTKKCVHAFVEIAGPNNVVPESFPKLGGKFISTKVFLVARADCMHSLNVFVKIMFVGDIDFVNRESYLEHVWNAFLDLIDDLKEVDRKPPLGQMLGIITDLLKETKIRSEYLDTVYSLLLTPILEREALKDALYTDTKEDMRTSNLYKIMSIALTPSILTYLMSLDKTISSEKLKKITNRIVDKENKPEPYINLILPQLWSKEGGLMFWKTLVESIIELDANVSVKTLKRILVAPLEHVHLFQNLEQPAKVWHTAYTAWKPKLSNTTARQDIAKISLKSNHTNHFVLYGLVHTVIDTLEDSEGSDCQFEADVFVKVLTKIKNHEDVEPLFPVLVSCSELMFKQVKHKNLLFAEYTVESANLILNFLLQSIKKKEGNESQYLYIEKILRQCSDLFSIDDYIGYKSLIVQQIINCASVCKKNSSIKSLVCSILKDFLKRSKPTEEPFYSTVRDVIVLIEKSQTESPKPKFTTPTTPRVIKKTKTKEPSIISTLVEDGEEFVVVKSNWKFNPRKLTENQKEKLQRKREDIPALYQDLSQSQDEFKLKSWKTDSQDTSSTSNSKSNQPMNEDMTSLLQKMPSFDMVPSILKNLLADGSKTNDIKNNEKPIDNNNKPAVVTLTPKQVKSPRMALKDRVSQNARNLIEKSSVGKEAGTVKDMNQTLSDAVTKTPPQKSLKKDIVATLSAPPKICEERPARVKRKPRKYELDFADIATKRTRNLVSAGDSQSGEIIEVTPQNNDFESMGVKTISNSEGFNKLEDMGYSEEIIKKPKTQSKDTTHCPVKVIDNIDNEVLLNEHKKFSDLHSETNSVDNATSADTKQIKIDKTYTDSFPDKAVNIKHEKVTTPKQKTGDLGKSKNSTNKPKNPRIMKELAIDMVEGHPFLKSEPGITSSRRKAVSERLNESANKQDSKLDKSSFQKKRNKNIEVKAEKPIKVLSKTVKDTQEGISTESEISDDIPMSEDFIESSQDSTLTTISVRSTKSNGKKLPLVVLDNFSDFVRSKKATETQNMLSESSDTSGENVLANNTTKDDIEFSRNKCIDEHSEQLTPDLDTEPMTGDDAVNIDDHSNDVINVDHHVPDNIQTKPPSDETIQTAEADTEPMDTEIFNKITENGLPFDETLATEANTEIEIQSTTAVNDTEPISTENEVIPSFEHVTENRPENNGSCSPIDDVDQRNKDFLNDTLEISPIKTMSPEKDTQKPPSPETSNDYVVITLSSPVQDNGEPFEKSGSPEVFTEDKVSPDKRDQSPPREPTTATVGSPSSSLSLKRNRPQVRAGGRAAQMLGLCVPDRLQVMTADRKTDEELTEAQTTRRTPQTTPARRNLRILYNCGENTDSNSDENDENSENFLRFQRALPTNDCSPSGPILKRKLSEICDESTMSPASKRKRVSFHDPPVSTTISVHKYIEPLGVRSPQSSNQKRQARHNNMKSPKKLENMFKLDSALIKTVDSFNEISNNSEDMEISSLDQTLSVEVVKTDELNDKDPICLELINSTDPISNIAAELSSPAMKDLLIKELEGKINTVGDLAKLTELEVNRLCIKAPKVKIAKRVLSEYAEKVLKESQDMGPVELTVDAQIHCSEPKKMDIDVQTEIVSVREMDAQTNEVVVQSVSSQTNENQVDDFLVQTVETGCKSTKDLVKECLEEKPDFIPELKSQLDDAAKRDIAETLSFSTLVQTVCKKISSDSDASYLLNYILKNSNEKSSGLLKLKELILLCSNFLQKDDETS